MEQCEPKSYGWNHTNYSDNNSGGSTNQNTNSLLDNKDNDNKLLPRQIIFPFHMTYPWSDVLRIKEEFFEQNLESVTIKKDQYINMIQNFVPKLKWKRKFSDTGVSTRWYYSIDSYGDFKCALCSVARCTAKAGFVQLSKHKNSVQPESRPYA